MARFDLSIEVQGIVLEEDFIYNADHLRALDGIKWAAKKLPRHNEAIINIRQPLVHYREYWHNLAIGLGGGHVQSPELLPSTHDVLRRR